VVRFVENSLSVDQLNITSADIPCVLGNGVGGTARSTHPVTLYITVNIRPPDLYNSPPSIPTDYDDSPAEGATSPGHIQFPAPEHPLPLSHRQPVEIDNTMPPQSREELSPTSTENPRFALHQADEFIKQIDRSDSWERAVGRIKWVMDTLGPIAEVRIMPFSYPWLS
jgi:hypothetical protein